MSNLTILLTLKGRKKFTKRWLDWLVLEKCSYKIIIADGDADKNYSKKLIKDPNYKYLDLNYIEFPEDVDFRQYLKKFNNSISLIKTKYAILADNDDFIIIENLKRAIEFMDANSDIQTLALPHYRFTIKNNLSHTDSNKNLYAYGGVINFQSLKHINIKKFNKKSVLSRLIACVKFFPSDYFFYSLHKTENLKKIIEISSKNQFQYIFFWERYITYAIGIIGNIGTNFSIDPFVVRQENTSMLASSLVDKEKLIKIRYSPVWTQQYHHFVDGLYEMSTNYLSLSRFNFSLFFSIYFLLNTQLRIFQGLIGSILKYFNLIYIYNKLNKVLLYTLGKSRINLNNDDIFKKQHLKKLSEFLNCKN